MPHLGLEVLGSKNIQIDDFTIQGAWPQDVEVFEFEVLGSKNIEFEFEGFGDPKASN